MKELKGCPFCGGKVDWCKNDMDFHRVNDDCHYINCDRCGEFSLNMLDRAEFPKVYDSLAEQWNTRASVEISKLQELIEIYQEDIDLGFEMRVSSTVIEQLNKLIDENSNG